MAEKKYLTSKEIMSYLNISYTTLHRYMQAGMPVVKPSTRKNLFDVEAVEKWLKHRSE